MPHRYFTPPAPEPQADGDGTYERSGAPQMPGLLEPAELIYDLERRAFDEPVPPIHFGFNCAGEVNRYPSNIPRFR